MTEQATVITGERVKLYQAAVIKQAMKLKLKGIVVNRSYTNRNMLDTATTFTGKRYNLRQLQRAIDDLDAWLVERRLELGIPESVS